MVRFRIVVVFTAALVLAVFAFAVASLARHGGAARSFGWRDAPQGEGWVIDSVDVDGPATSRLRVGDRLLSIDGDTLVGHFGAGSYRRTQPIGKNYTVRIARDGREVEYTLAVGAGRSQLGRRLAYLIASFVWCAVGLFIGYARPDDAAARLAFAAAVSTGIVYIQMNILTNGMPGALYQPFHLVLGYHFFYRFPAGVRRGKFSRALLWLFYAWGALAFAIRQSLNWTYYTAGPGATAAWTALHPVLAWLNMELGAALVFPVVIAAATLVGTTYRQLNDADLRRRIRLVVYLSVVGLSPLLLWAAFAVVDGITGPGLSPIPPRARLLAGYATLLGTTLIPVGVAYAVVRHRVFDIAVVVRRGLQYLLAKRALQTLIALPTVAVAFAAFVHRDRTVAQLVSENATYFWLIAAAALSLRYRQPLGNWLDRRFSREQYNREKVLVGLLADLGRLSEPADVSHLVRAQVEYALHPSVLRLWFEGDPNPPSEQLLAAIEPEGAGPDTPLTSGDHLPDGISLVVPLESSDEKLAGVLMLGAKRSEEPYSANDLSLLGVVAKQAAVMRENLLLRASISEEQRIRTDVLAHLGPDRVNLVKECPACGSCYDSTADLCTRDGRRLALSLPVARTVAGRYRLDALIGRGGMGAVYEALDLRLERIVAIKFLLGKGFGQHNSARRFRREARAVARIHHPNIVSVYDYGGLGSSGAYLVMERIRGVTLREELVCHGSLSGPAAAEWFAPLLDGVAAAHEEGIVHRDLKPENVVRLRPEYGPPVVKILDFGIAKVRPVDTASDHLTASGTVVGTLGYMSPEQLTGCQVDARSDVFSVGVMVVEALTGRWPFQGAGFGELVASIVLEPYSLPGATPEVRALDALLQRCLAKEPNDRFDSAAALRHELVPALRVCPALTATPPRASQ